MKASLGRIEGLHEALIAALDRNDLAGIETVSQELAEALAQLRGFDSWLADPELKLAAERVSRLADAATMRVNVLNDHARRRSEALAATRGQAAPVTYGR
ncbi:MAG TPA: hypothetical protein VF603_14455 [Allosphingosinicella sp.]|jgi:hypothetical protein